MKIFIGSDHAGFKRKFEILEHLKSSGNKNNFQVQDCGVFTEDRADYPDIADSVCKEVLNQSNSIGVLICGSGQGMCMRANRYLGIRAGLPYSVETAELIRAHNDANVICLGARTLTLELTIKMLGIFLTQGFEGGRHQDRVNKLEKL